MTLKLPHWFASASMAVALHIGLFVLVMNNHTQGALAEGKHGIEIDLGMLGDFGEHMETQFSKVEAIPQKTLPTEKVVKKIEEILPITLPIQTADSVVFEEKAKPEILEEKQSPKDETILVDEQVLADAKEMQEPQLDKSTLENNAVKKRNTQTQTKQSTGEANSLNNGGQSGLDQSYLAKLLAQLAQHKRYPLSSRKKAEEGVAVLDFEISRTGRVLVSNIQKSSGFNALDKAVLVMLKRAEPFPPVPPDIKGEPIRFTLPIAFKLNG